MRPREPETIKHDEMTQVQLLFRSGVRRVRVYSSPEAVTVVSIERERAGEGQYIETDCQVFMIACVIEYGEIGRKSSWIIQDVSGVGAVWIL